LPVFDSSESEEDSEPEDDEPSSDEEDEPLLLLPLSSLDEEDPLPLSDLTADPS